MKYTIKPYRRLGRIVAWGVITPDNEYIKVEYSFDDAVVWMDIHAGHSYGSMEMA